MRTIFFKTFIAFLLALFIFMTITFFILFYGFNNSVKKWENEKNQSFYKSIETILENIFKENQYATPEVLDKELRYSIGGNFILTLYDKDKNPFYVLRKIGFGKLRRLDENIKLLSSDIRPIIIDGKIASYYLINLPDFSEDRTNKNFIQSINITLIISFFISFLIASFFAFIFSQKLSREAKKVSDGINQIVQGNLSLLLDEKGTKEIALISKSTNILSKKLKKEEELRNQWAQDIAHDLRTPTTALKTQLEGIIDGALELSLERIKKNLKEVYNIEHLINDLSELTRLESPEIKVNIKKFNVNDLLENIKSTFQSEINKKKINFQINNSLNIISGDEKLLNRALSNIVSNAIKYTKNKGSVSINSYKKNNYNFFEIFNSDSFISNEEQDKIFDRLYRGEFSRNTEGSGLGLTISKKIIDLHNGDIKVDSNNKGTTFIISLKYA